MELPKIDSETVKQKWGNEIKELYEGKESGIAVIFYTTVTQEEGFEKDPEKVVDTFSSLQFSPLVTEQPSVDEMLAYFEAIRKYNPTRPDDKGHCLVDPKTSNLHYILSYFSGYGGCGPNGEVYVYLDETTQKKVYINWIVNVLKQRYNEKHSCVLLFELYCHPSYTDDITPSLPSEDNFIIAISGFKKSIPPFDNVSKWTEKICQALESCNIPLTDILASIEKELFDQSPQHVSCTGTLFLNETLASHKVESVSQQINSTDIGIMLMVTSPKLLGASEDKSRILSTFKSLEFTVIEDDAPVDYNNVLALIKAVAYYGSYPVSYKFFAFYYSGYGGSDNGRGYIEFDDQRIYLDWIVSLFNQKVSPQPCLLFFELCSRSAYPDDSVLLIPSRRKFLVATSGLNTVDVGRTIRGGKWTQTLCDNIDKCDKPITTLIKETQNQLLELSSQFLCSTGLVYLKKPLRVENKSYEYFKESYSLS